MPDNDGSVSDSQSWGIISLDGMSDAVNEIKEPPAITHPVFRKLFHLPDFFIELTLVL